MFLLNNPFFVFFANSIFVVLHLNTPSCPFKYVKSSDIIVVNKEILLKVYQFLSFLCSKSMNKSNRQEF